MHTQLPLPLATAAAPSFANFCRGENGLAVDLVAALLTDEVAQYQLFLWGGDQCGKSHLLLAAHQAWLAAGRRSFYASLSDSSLPASLVDSIDDYDLVALDDIDHVAHQPDWEQALFNLINFSRERGGKLIFSAGSPPSAELWVLPDLISRLSWGPVVKLESLNETDMRSAICDAAENRGMQLDAEAADFLLKRYRRDANSLLHAIATLDTESLAAGRARITIPFMKRCLVFD